MRILTKQEELVLLAVYQLRDNAYLITIRDLLMANTGREWAFGSIYVCLERLKNMDYIATRSGEAVPVQGGKAIKFYELRQTGIEALEQAKAVNDAMWSGFSMRSGQ